MSTSKKRLLWNDNMVRCLSVNNENVNMPWFIVYIGGHGTFAFDGNKFVGTHGTPNVPEKDLNDLISVTKDACDYWVEKNVEGT